MVYVHKHIFPVLRVPSLNDGSNHLRMAIAHIKGLSFLSNFEEIKPAKPPYEGAYYGETAFIPSYALNKIRN